MKRKYITPKITSKNEIEKNGLLPDPIPLSLTMGHPPIPSSVVSQLLNALMNDKMPSNQPKLIPIF